MAHTVNLRVFEGPLDLLLHLVRVNEMEITDIHIAEITDQYLRTLQAMRDLDLEVAGDYLVMAATLINLKARSLLPPLPEGEGEEEEGEEISEIMNARQLMRQLVEYRKFKEMSVELAARQEDQLRIFHRNSLLAALNETRENPPLRAELGLLFDCFARVLAYVESLPHHDVAFEPFSVEQRLGALRLDLQRGAPLQLFDLFRHCRNKADMIVTFLALLELSRLREIRLEQGGSFEDVHVLPRPREEREVSEGEGPSHAAATGSGVPTPADAQAMSMEEMKESSGE